MRLLLHAAVFTIIAPGTVTVGIPALIVWLTGASPVDDVALPASGVVLIAIGVAGWAWCLYDFLMRGRGTPAPYLAPEELVVHGLYRQVRNPMYVMLVLVLLGEAVLFASPSLLVWAAALFVAFHLRVVVYEEPTLARQFGVSWDRYRDATPRWLPRV